MIPGKVKNMMFEKNEKCVLENIQNVESIDGNKGTILKREPPIPGIFPKDQS